MVSKGLAVVAHLLLSSLLSVPAFAVGPNDALPIVTLRDTEGEPTALSYTAGRVTYVDFWASWCAPCQESLPWMNSLVEKYADRGLDVIAVSVDRERSQAEKSLKRVKPQYQVLFDPEGAAAKSFRVPTMPTSYLIDQNGKIVRVHRGFRAFDKASLEHEIDVLLGSPTH